MFWLRSVVKFDPFLIIGIFGLFIFGLITLYGGTLTESTGEVFWQQVIFIAILLPECVMQSESYNGCNTTDRRADKKLVYSEKSELRKRAAKKAWKVKRKDDCDVRKENQYRKLQLQVTFPVAARVQRIVHPISSWNNRPADESADNQVVNAIQSSRCNCCTRRNSA